MFPEGTRTRTPTQMGPVRKGVGRLVAAAARESGVAPLVVPFVHAGMEAVLPVGRMLPCTGQTVGARARARAGCRAPASRVQHARVPLGSRHCCGAALPACHGSPRRVLLACSSNSLGAVLFLPPQVRVAVGAPIPVDDLLATAQREAWSDHALYAAISDRIGSRLHAMHARLHADTACSTSDAAQALGEGGLQGAGGVAGLCGGWGRSLLPGPVLEALTAFKGWHRQGPGAAPAAAACGDLGARGVLQNLSGPYSSGGMYGAYAAA